MKDDFNLEKKRISLLKKYKKLHDSGVINDKDYETIKERILNPNLSLEDLDFKVDDLNDNKNIATNDNRNENTPKKSNKKKIILSISIPLSIIVLISVVGGVIFAFNPFNKSQTNNQYYNVTTATPNKSSIISTNEKYTIPEIEYKQDTKGLDIVVHYHGQQGITYRENRTIINPIDNIRYEKGSLLPVWNSFQNTLKTTFRDANDYTSSSDSNLINQFINANFMSATDSSQYVDVIMGNIIEINNQGTFGQIVDLSKHLDDMPYFKYFLENNPSIRKMIECGDDKAIYYTPFFDGYNAIERMFLMDTTMIKNLLDSADGAGDSTVSGKGGAANTLGEAKYTAFIDADYNYAQDTTVKISVNGVAKDLTIKKTENIIKQQNELLANGCTGAQLLDQFKTYLKSAFGSNYSKLSDIFISESAAYNTDEMIALMRVVKANPGLAVGNADAEIEIMIPRQGTNNRVDNIADLMEIFGVSMDSESIMLFFDGAGMINDGASIMATYDALEKLSALYDEGLIIPEFWTNSPANKDYLGIYFGKTIANAGYGFMMYDYSAPTTSINSIDVDGIGTDDSTRVGTFKDTRMEGFMPVLPPLTYWTTKEMTKTAANAKLGSESDRSVKELIRYSDSNRALKNSSWAIPSSTDNLEKALQLLDILYSREGRMVNDFGPTLYWKSATDLGTYGGKETPEFSQSLKNWLLESGLDFWSFMRGYLGATFDIGYERSTSINYLATNKWGKIGTLNIESAISSGVVTLALLDNPDKTKLWANSIPIYKVIFDNSAYEEVTKFWQTDKCDSEQKGWVAVVAADSSSDLSSINCGTTSKGYYTYNDVLNKAKTSRRQYYYNDFVASLGNQYLPSYI